MGTHRGIEAQVVPKAGIDMEWISIAGLRGRGLTAWLSAPFLVCFAVCQALRVLLKSKPVAVLGLGGFVSAPGGLAAWLIGRPLLIHEQNAVAGMSNRWLAKFANKVLAAFPSAFAKEQCEVVGNPVRASVANVTAKQTTTPINVLVVGGSLGAQVLNETLPAVFSELSALTTLNIWHQTGKNNEPNVTASYQRLGLTENSKVAEFIDDMDSAYQWADLVICRAGALTVSEIAAAGRMALFVPFPHAVDDHQTANAKYLVTEQAALIMQQSEFNQAAVVELLTPYVNAPEKISTMASKAKQLAILDATANVAKRCEQLADRRD